MSKTIPRRRGALSAAIRIALLGLWTVVMVFAWLVRRIPLSTRARPAEAARFLRWWCLGTLRLLGIRVAVYGRVPSRPFLLVANHVSYLDVAAIISVVPCTFVSKSEVAEWPVLGSLVSLACTLYVDRKSRRDTGRMCRLIRSHFAAGGSLTMFPEGTSTAGTGVAPFRSALLEFPAAANYPVHCAALRYHTPPGFAPASQAMAWWGDADFLPHFLELFRIPGMRAEIAFANAPVSGPDRKSLAALLHDTVAERLGFLLDRTPYTRTIPDIEEVMS